jgi:LPPG:FO 2-phospho-L-lactate transferase
MKVTALAGGVGAGKFLRGLVRAVPPEDLTVVVNTGDDIVVHGLHVSPDVDSVMYWMAGVADRDRGWGRAGETFRATEELRAFDAPGSWFGLGDLDLATHLLRTSMLASGATLTGATAALAARFGVRATLLPMTDDSVTTRIDAVDEQGAALDLHFQEYWVRRQARDHVKAVRYEGASAARPGPAVLESLRTADAVVLCPSNPIASIGPILAVPGIRDELRARRDRVVAVTPIVGGAPLRGMADRLLPAAGVEVSAAGVAGHYADSVGGFVVDRVDGAQAARVAEALGGGVVAVTDTIMVDDDAAHRLADVALALVASSSSPSTRRATT